eukprot:GHVP01060464.1.p1 GENE.GHVP01060464.1~~GHVP01060464.1.p1  ORF type:complete len:375 (+),score=57.86 GHVP01060464.1:338-1462(+)
MWIQNRTFEGNTYEGILSSLLRKTYIPPAYNTKNIDTFPTNIVKYNKIEDDYYSNVVDWSPAVLSSTGTIAVSGCHELSIVNPQSNNPPCPCIYARRKITSVKWCPWNISAISFGTDSGSLYIEDLLKPSDTSNEERNPYPSRLNKKIVDIDWRNKNELLFSSGSKSYYLDTRLPFESCLSSNNIASHNDQICSIKWNRNELLFATGGNDNIINVWDIRIPGVSLISYNEHQAAVRALSWSPFNQHLLISGGGVADQSIKLWGVNSNKSLLTLNVGSQVCSIKWLSRESSSWWSSIITSHGFSENDIRLWQIRKSPRIDDIEIINEPNHIFETGSNNKRMLHVLTSPDESIALGAAPDFGMFFWDMNKKGCDKK